MVEKKYVLPSGASRSERAPRYHLIPPNAYRAWADRMELGEGSHGAFNWLKGAEDESFQIETLNHLEEHLRLLKAGDRTDDHLAAILASAGFLREFQALGVLRLPQMFTPQLKKG